MINILDAYGRPVEERANLKEPPDWLRDILVGTRSTSGESVNPKVAMTVMAFYACVRNISEDIAKLPKKIRQKNGNIRQDLNNHPVSRILRRPNEINDRHSFWQTIIAHALTYKGGFAEIVRDGAGRPTALYLLDPTSVNIVTDNVTGAPMYHITGMPPNMLMTQDRVLHIHGLGYDGVTGYTVPQLAKELLGASIALQKYRGAFFGNGAQPSGILTHPAALSDLAQERLRRQFKERFTGAENSHGILTLEEGMTWTQLSVNPENAQMVELTNVTVEDICRIYRMPPHKIQHLEKATFSNIEHQGLEYDRDTLDPWVDKLRSQIDFKLILPEEQDAGVSTYINMNALHRADIATRTQHYKDMYYLGAYNANRILDLEDENPVDGGDRYFVQQNLIPADMVDEQFASEPEPVEPMAPDMRSSFTMIMERCISNILRVEADKAKRGRALPEFYQTHKKRVCDQVADYIRCVSVGLGKTVDAIGIADQYAAFHCIQSIGNVENGNLTTWHDGTRARDAAELIIEEIYKCNTAA